MGLCDGIRKIKVQACIKDTGRLTSLFKTQYCPSDHCEEMLIARLQAIS